jgi:hypothetical protein
MKREKTPREIRDELLQSFLELEASYFEGPTTTVPEKRVAYLELEFCEHLLNAIKALEYHYRDDVPEMRTKKRWNSQLKRANNLLKKYGENSDKNSEYSKLQLKLEFDSSGYLEHRNYIREATDKRLELKRKP